jgi:hypothetical protein
MLERIDARETGWTSMNRSAAGCVFRAPPDHHEIPPPKAVAELEKDWRAIADVSTTSQD